MADTDIPTAPDDRDDDLITLGYAFDGAATLAALAVGLRRLADDLDARAAEGWGLDEPVEGGRVRMSPPGGAERRRRR